jgi:hypothetical protein
MRGHLHRLRAVAAHLRIPVTGLSSLPCPDAFEGRWVQLPTDVVRGAVTDPTAGGTLHWAPRRHEGLRERMAAVAAWVGRERPDVVVVDVSVEVAVLVRSMGVPVVVAAMRGDRTDRAHRMAYDLADALLAPWPASLPEPWPQRWLDKTWHVGAVSRLDARPRTPVPNQRRVAVLWGSGGGPVSVSDVDRAAVATPGWSWHPLGVPGAQWVPDPWPVLQAADVVVTHAGQNALAEVAAARRPAVVLPQRRPHDEQVATGRALDAAGLAVVADGPWPQPEQWPSLLERATALDPAAWHRWSDGLGASRAARHLEALCP